jgi:hypothetical protein
MPAALTSMLLDNMNKLVRDQPFPFRGGRRELAGAKNNIAAHGESTGADRASNSCSTMVGVNPDLTEVMSEAWFKEGSERLGKGLTATSQSPDLRSHIRRELRYAAAVSLCLNDCLLVIYWLTSQLLIAPGAHSLYQ